ncbi:MAG: hypothetical protein ACPL28_11645 [bacterium]
METLTIPAQYKNKKLKPLTQLPKDGEYEAIIVLIRADKQKNHSRLLKLKPLSLGKELKSLTRGNLYENYR